jgi:peroxiredoxin
MRVAPDRASARTALEEIPMPIDGMKRLVRVEILILYFLLLGSASLVVILVGQKGQLERETRELSERVRWPYAGLTLPVVPARTLSGERIELANPSQGGLHVLFFLNSTCAYCLETLPEWKRLASEFSESPGIEFFGVSVDTDSATRAYAADHELGFSVVVLSGEREVMVLRAEGVPQTAVVNGDGKVIYAYRGPLNRDRVAMDSLRVVLRGAQSRSNRELQASR